MYRLIRGQVFKQIQQVISLHFNSPFVKICTLPSEKGQQWQNRTESFCTFSASCGESLHKLSSVTNSFPGDTSRGFSTFFFLPLSAEGFFNIDNTSSWSAYCIGMLCKQQAPVGYKEWIWLYCAEIVDSRMGDWHFH